MWVERHGDGWRVRDRAGGRVITIRGGFLSKTAAKNFATKKKADKLRGDELVPRGGDLTLAEWIDYWWPSYEVTLKSSSRTSSFGIINRYLKPMLGHIRLDEFDPVLVQRWVADLLAGRTLVKHPRKLARKTAANAHGLLHKIMGEAVGQRLIRANPCERTRMPQKVHHEMTFLSPQEAEQLLAIVDDHYKPLVLLLLGTGLRWGEAVGLQVGDVDVLEQRLHVRRNLQELADTAEMIEEAPKTAASRRTVSFTPDVAEMLIPLVSMRSKTARVFTAPKGGEVRYRVFWPRWNRWRKLADVPTLRIHDLRHSHAAWLISSNIRGGLTAVQRRLGHSSIRVTSDLYGHLLREVDDDIMQVLTDRLPRISGSSMGAALDDATHPEPTLTHSKPL